MATDDGTNDDGQNDEEPQGEDRRSSSSRPSSAQKRTTGQKKAAAQKRPAQKRPTREQPAKERPSPQRRSPDTKDDDGSSSRPERSTDGGGQGGRRVSATQAAREAADVLSALIGRPPEAVVGIERTDEGWQVRLEVVESHRIPDTSDLMGLYDVELDASGDFTGHRRVRRYSRGQGGDG